MAYISGFSDNQLVGVDDLNAITKRLITSGVGYTLTDTGNINVTQLNGYNAAIVTSGVVPTSVTSLKVTKSGSSVSIAPGVAFFEDGSFIELTSAYKATCSYASFYVYLLNDIASGTRRPKITQTAPTGDYVMLAQISGSTVLDKRTYAKGKVPSYASYTGYPLFVSQSVTCTGETKYNRKGSFTVDIGDYPLHGILVSGEVSGTPHCTGICLFDENKNVKMYRSVANYNLDNVFTNYLHQYYYNAQYYAYMKFSCTQSGVLTVNVTSSSSLNSAGTTEIEKIEFMIF